MPPVCKAIVGRHDQSVKLNTTAHGALLRRKQLWPLPDTGADIELPYLNARELHKRSLRTRQRLARASCPAILFCQFAEKTA